VQRFLSGSRDERGLLQSCAHRYHGNSPQQLVLHLAHLAEGCMPGGITPVSSLSTAALSFGNGMERKKERILPDGC